MAQCNKFPQMLQPIPAPASAITPAEVARLGAIKLVPGMPLETFIKTGDRSVASYFIKPMIDQAKPPSARVDRQDVEAQQILARSPRRAYGLHASE
ncbi:hypothetical protein C7476_11934 [Phyllobacterium bourgognense]|uniref:Uncharacterized protein n=1 Tax=Phyllobacterium bourgognense TaxID=314236 RepID=A0A368YFU8_9HYPH|nr:hypothetical protein C7476_11934 [Phyllobacterium bourgognense]